MSYESIKEALEARVPELAKSFEAHMRNSFAYVSSLYPEGIPEYPRSGQAAYLVIREFLSQFCDGVAPEGADPFDVRCGRVRKLMKLNEEALKAVALKRAEAAALEWFNKIEGKLGPVSDVRISWASGASFCIKASLPGDLPVRIEQQMIIKQSPKGRLFNQFPSRIYVANQFTPEANYAKLFKVQA